MNLHLPQDEISRAEAEFVVSADRQYTTPTSGLPLRGLIQDHVVAGVLITKRDTFFNRADFQQLFYGASDNAIEAGQRVRSILLLTRGGQDSSSRWKGAESRDRGVSAKQQLDTEYTICLPCLLVPWMFSFHCCGNLIQLKLPTPAILKPEALWTGKQLITSVLKLLGRGKVMMNLDGKARTKAEMVGKEDAEVLIRDGELLCGVLDKAQFGDSAFGLGKLPFSWV